MLEENFEPFVAPARAAEFLAMERRQLLTMSREGKVPAHAIDETAGRKMWRYRLSELAEFMQGKRKQPYNGAGNRGTRKAS